MNTFKRLLAAVFILALVAVPAWSGDYPAGGGGGSGTVTNVTSTCGIGGGPITTTGELTGQHLDDVRTTTSEAILDADCGDVVIFNNAAAIAATIAQAGTAGDFAAGWFVILYNFGAGTVTLTPTVSSIDGGSPLTLLTGQSTILSSDATDYWTTGTAIATEAQGVQDVFNLDITTGITGANSKANCFKVGNGTEYWCLWWDGTRLRDESGNTAMDRVAWITTNKAFHIYDEEGAANMITIDPDAASPNAMYQVAAAYRERHSVVWPAGSMSTDGTECTAPTEITINSGHIRWAIVCPMPGTEIDGSIYGAIQMPDSWDAGTVTFHGEALIDNDGGAGTFHGDIACQSVGDTDTVSASYGTGADLDFDEIAGDVVWDTIKVSGDAAVTCSGTPVAGDTLYWRWKACDTDATPSTNCTTSTAATITDLSITSMKMEYTQISWSD